MVKSTKRTNETKINISLKTNIQNKIENEDELSY